jgi:general secretion pathway protein G
VNRVWIRAGFTLIEVLVVITVIAILAGLVAPNVFRHLGTAQETAARSQIEMLAIALDSYRLDMGSYPSSAQGLEALRSIPEGATPRRWRGPYVRKDVPTDPWGNAYTYSFPSDDVYGGFELISYGADGAPGGGGGDTDIAFGG